MILKLKNLYHKHLKIISYLIKTFKKVNTELYHAIIYSFILSINLIKNIKNIVSKKNDKSVYFLGNNYIGFYNLAEGLQKTGWKAVSVNPTPDCNFSPFYHSVVDLSVPKDVLNVFVDIISNYRFLHVYNRTDNVLYTGHHWFLKKLVSVKTLKKFGVKFIFTPSGCLDGSSSKEISNITNGLCNKCIWQDNFCNDTRNNIRTQWLSENCDLFSNEVDLPKKLSKTHIGFNLPLLPLNSKNLDPNIIIPEEYKISSNTEEIIIFTAFGNQNLRTSQEKDIKGKKYIFAAINKLIDEGFKIKHFHATNVAIQNMRYYQNQADIIIDQLNYGSIGSAAREGMMLGKPVICHISALMRASNLAMLDCPAIDANEQNIYEVLKNLTLLPEAQRKEIGIKSREWMTTWYDIDACVQRYDKVTNHLLNNKSIKSEKDFI